MIGRLLQSKEKMTNKKRILFVNEFSQLATGFSTYGNEVMRRLNATGKYELAELASYCSPEDQRVFDVPWQVYPTMPRANDKAGWDQYHAIKTAQFGSTALSSCLLDFKPDITIEIRDPWMSEHNLTNPFRPFHKFIWMATIDGEPQKPEWLDSYRRTDYLLTYSEWAANLVKSKGINVAGTHQPGTDLDVYCPAKDKRQAKEDIGINPDWFIVQTVMRNQPRKLYPELLKSFSRFIELCKESGKDELAAKTYLHIHCALRDVGWDLAQEIKNYHLAHKVLFTYVDRSNGRCYLSFYKGEPAWSRDNNQKSSGSVSTGYGVSREQLAKIMQIADVYVQLSICVDGNTLIHTAGGLKPIQEIQVGESVLTHTNTFQKVTETFKNNLGDRDMYKITGEAGHGEILCTGEHPLYIIDDPTPENKENLRSRLGSLIRNEQDLYGKKFVPADQIKPGDILVSPIDQSVEDIQYLDLAKYLENNENYTISDTHITVLRGKEYQRFIKLDEEFCKFIGMFIGDGYAGENCVKITCQKDELENIELAKFVFDKYDQHSVNQYTNRDAVDINISSCVWSDAFRNLFYKDKVKTIPEFIFKLPNHKQKAVLLGLCLADGCDYSVSSKHNKSTFLFCNTSENVISGVQRICDRLGLVYNCHWNDRKKDSIRDGKNRVPIARIEIPGNIFLDKIRTDRNNTRNFIHNGYKYTKVKSIEKVDYKEDYVYNIEVANDNSYVTNFTCVHNCEGFGMPVIDAKACGVPVMGLPYSATAELVVEPGGIPLKIAGWRQESIQETSQRRCEPDNEYTARELFKFFTANQKYRDDLGKEARDCVVNKYGWDDCAKKWETLLDSIAVPDHSETWNSPPQIHRPELQSVPNNLPPESFIGWCYQYIVGRPWLLTYSAFNTTLERMTTGNLTKDNLIKECMELCENYNRAEIGRHNMMNNIKPQARIINT